MSYFPCPKCTANPEHCACKCEKCKQNKPEFLQNNRWLCPECAEEENKPIIYDWPMNPKDYKYNLCV